MPSKYRSLALCAFFVLPALALSACGSDVPGNSVAKIGDQSIQRDTFNHWMQIAAVSSAGQTSTTGTTPKAQVPDAPNFTKCVAQKKATAAKPAKGTPEATPAQLKGQCQTEYNALRDQVLEFLIRGNWIEQETKKQNLKVTDKDVQKQIDAAVKQAFQNPQDFQKFLQRSGLTEADVFYQQRNQLLQQKLTEKVTKAQGKVTDAQIQQYYDKNKSKFSTPERRDLRIVLTKTKEEAAAARKALDSGQSWSSVAKKYSIDQASKAQGGKLAGVAKGQQEKALDDAIFKADKGKLVGPGQDAVRLVHPRGLEGRRRQAAVARAVERVDQADPHERQPAQGPRHSSARTTASGGRPRRRAARATRRPTARTARRPSRRRRPRAAQQQTPTAAPSTAPTTTQP